MSATDTIDLTATQLVAAYRRGDLSPVEATRAFLTRCEQADPHVGAWRFLDVPGALEMARRSEERYRHLAPLGPLDGVPLAIKDDLAVKGWDARHGSRVTSADRAASDAPSVAGFRRHGAVFLGRTTMPEVGWKAVTDSPLTGVTRNPWDRRLTPGGSSGGNAAALALRMTPLAVGSDIGGSVRIPAAFCGVVGFKSTQGRVPMDPRTKTGMLLQAGPMARTVEDAAVANQVVTEWGPTDPPPPGLDADQALGGGVRGLRIALAVDFNGADPDPEIRAAIEAVAAVLAEQGAHVEVARPDLGPDVQRLYERLYGPMLATEVAGLPADRRQEMDPGFLEAAEPWRETPAVDFVDAMYTRRRVIQATGVFHQKYDLLLTPTVPIPPFATGRESPPERHGQRWWTWTPCTWPVNLTGQPAISVPCGVTGDGLPMGAQLIGARHKDAVVLRAAHVYQRARPDLLRRPDG
jgi:aspartyl-tRNA(Asn)/glutamyl-tRNA(Gln) amidotransferase subunit A